MHCFIWIAQQNKNQHPHIRIWFSISSGQRTGHFLSKRIELACISWIYCFYFFSDCLFWMDKIVMEESTCILRRKRERAQNKIESTIFLPIHCNMNKLSISNACAAAVAFGTCSVVCFISSSFRFCFFFFISFILQWMAFGAD